MFGELMFNFRFGSKKHVREYVELVNSLIQQGRQRVFASEQEIQKSVESGTCPKVDTSNHIRMMYSIFTAKDGMRHHVSISRSPYLATRYAKHLTALFCNLSGLPIPEVVYQSAQSIYHVEFVLSPTQQDRFEALAEPDRNDPKTIFLKAFMDSIPIRVEPLGMMTNIGGTSI